LAQGLCQGSVEFQVLRPPDILEDGPRPNQDCEKGSKGDRGEVLCELARRIQSDKKQIPYKTY